MTPALLDLARRAVAAGAPEADDNTVIVIPGVSFRSIATGLVYDGATRLPWLSDPSWVGWTLAEAERRGYWACVSTKGDWAATRPGFSVTGGPGDIPSALVAMLKATR